MLCTRRRSAALALATATMLALAVGSACSKDKERKRPSEGATEQAAEEASPPKVTPAPDQATSDSRAERARLAAERRSQRTERGAAPAEPELPPVLSVEDHARRAEREIDEKNYATMLDEVEKDIEMLERRNAPPAERPETGEAAGTAPSAPPAPAIETP